PLLHGGFFHLDRRGAGTAHQVMVVFLCGAGSVDGLSRVGAQDIDLTGVAQGLYGPVNRGESDLGTFGAQVRVQVLRAAETGGLSQRLTDNFASRTHLVTLPRSLWSIVPTSSSFGASPPRRWRVGRWPNQPDTTSRQTLSMTNTTARPKLARANRTMVAPGARSV